MQNDAGWSGIFGVVIGTAITALLAWLAQRSKSSTDQSVAVLDQWSKLNKGISDRLEAVEREFSEYRHQMAKEVEGLRRDHSAEIEKIRRDHSAEIDEMRNKHRTEMQTMREQNDELRKRNDALQRIITQNSQSTAHLLGELSAEGDAKDDPAE